MPLVLGLLLQAFAAGLDPGQPALIRAGALALLCLAGAAIYVLAGFLLGAFDAFLPLRLLRLRGASARTPRS